MEFVVPISGFIFVLSGLAALARIRRGEGWELVGFLAALSFAVMMFFVIAFASNR